MANGPLNKHPRLQDRLRPDTVIKISYDGQGEEPRFITGYWSIRGLGAPIRMMLSAAQVNHWIVMYDVREDEGEDSGWSRESWARDKEWIQQGYNCLANLPFLIDCRNNMVLVQTNAIMCYLGREFNMFGRSPPMICRCEELLCEIMDLRNHMTKFAYLDPNLNDADDDAVVLVQGPAALILDKLEMLLEHAYPGAIADDSSSSSGDPLPPQTPQEQEQQQIEDAEAVRRMQSICFLVGNRCTAPDFCLYEMLDQYNALCRYYILPLVTVDRPYLAAYWRNFASLPEHRPFFECTAGHALLPFNNPYARFGSDWETHGPYEQGQEATWRKLGIIKEFRTRSRPTKRPRTSRSSSSINNNNNNANSIGNGTE